MTYTQKHKFKVSRFKRQIETNEQTDGQTDAVDCFIFPANVVGKIN